MKRIGLAVVVSTLAACSLSERKTAPSSEAPAVGVQRAALVQTFAAGSLIIPMDTTSQDLGTLRAFGLVDKLLRVSVPVNRIIKGGKAHQDIDFSATVTNRRTGAALGSVDYRSSPFVVAAADATPATLAIVDAYLTANANVNVHVATAAFDADVSRTLVASPRVSALRTGNQAIIYGYLNAAGITDANGNPWSDASPGSITLAQLAGATNGGALDGALMNGGGLPAYDQFTVVHYQPTGGDPSLDEMTRELRGWLISRPTNHAHLQCSSTLVFENNAAHGHFLTNLGIGDVGGNSDPVEVLQPQSLYAQYAGTLQIDPGDTKSFALNSGSTLWDNSSLLVQLAASVFGTRMNWLTGYVDGNTSLGKISYLGGHSYSTTLPISSNPRTNGVRLFLNGLFETPALFGTMQPTLTLTKSAPAYTNSTSVTFTVSYSNTGPGIAYGAAVSDALPAGTTFVSATGGGVHSSGTVTWTLGDLAPGASGSMTVTVTAPQGTYQNQAVLSYKVGITPKTYASNITTTVVDTTRPVTTILTTPANPTNATGASFTFSASEAATFQCDLDGAGFTACTSPRAYTGLAAGSHTFTVRATDLAGNAELSPPSYTWTVDLTAPGISFTSTPPANTNSTSATFAFTVTGATTVECQLNAGAFAPCTSPQTLTGLAEGTYTFTVRATDAAGNVSTSSYDWVVDTTAPALAFTSTPGNPTNQTTATFGFSVSGASTVECQHAPGAYAACTSPVTLTGLSDGSHTFNVRATDAASNVATISYTWMVNTVAPTVTITAGPANPTTATTANISFTVTSALPLASTECRLNAGAFTACTSPVSFTGLADGSYTLTVRATDTSANVGSANHIWVVDTTAPGVTFNGTPANPSNVASGDLGFAVNEPATTTCSFDSGAFAACSSPYLYGPLADGSHSLAVRAADGAGNVTTETFTWTVDTQAPALAFTSTPASPTNQTAATLTFTVTGASTVECRLDTGSFAACTSPVALTGLADGSHTFAVRATDAAGNVSTISHTWTVDTQAPALAFTSTPADPTASTSAAFAFTVTGATTVECRLDTGAFAACTSPTTLAGLADGSHTYTVRASDAAGNVSTVSHTWTVDTVPPDVTLTSVPSDPSNAATATFTFSVTGGATSIECSLDGATFTACTSPQSFSGLADGAHTFRVRGTDAAGNARTVSHTWTVDTAAPDTTFTATPPAATSATTASFTFTATEGGTFECSLDGAAFAACLSPASLTGLAEGSHTYRARAVDAAGNLDATPASFTWVVDTTAPTTTLDSTPAAASNATSASFTFSSNEGTATFECSLDGAAFAACTSPQALSGLAEGSHTFAVRAVDAAGNTDGTPASFTWTVDVTLPDTTLTAGPTGTVSSAAASFSFTSTEAGTFECSLDGAAFAACPTPHALTGLAEGNHTLQVRAVDTAGNRDASPASRTWTVDTVEPTTSIDVGPSGFLTVSGASFEFSSNEFAATFECSLDGAAFAACTSPLALASLAEGSHTFAVRAVDAAGNRDGTPATRTFTVDTLAPDTTLVAGPTGAVSATSATFAFSSDDAAATFECNLDGAGFTACGAAPTFSGLAEGSHTLAVRAVDAAGNRDATPASRTWTVDTVEPTTTINSGPTGPTASATATFDFASSEAGATFECAVDGGAFAACSDPATLTGLAEGAHTLQVRAVDAAGNRDATPASLTWTVDTVVPDTTLLTAPSGLVNVSTASFTFSSGEAGVTFECSVDNATFTACTSPVSLSAIVDGTHTFQVRARDAAGNVDATPATATWQVDAAEPDTVLTAGPTGTVAATSATFEFTSTKANSTFQCSLDGAAFAACPTPSTLTGLADGSHTFQVRAVDPATNVDSSPASRTWTVDTAAPETTVVTALAAVTNSPTATLDFSSNEAGATFECSLDGATFTACSDPASLSGLADGLHVLLVRAVDAAGNRDATPGLVTWTVDTQAPGAPRVLEPVAGATTGAFPTFGGTAEPGSTVTVTSGGTTVCTAVAAADGSWSCAPSTALPTGSTTVTATSTDPAGNTSPASPPLTFTVNPTTPETLLSGGPSGLVASTSADFTLASLPAGATFECSLDGAAFTTCTSAPAYTNLAQGAHRLEVRAVSNGQRDPTPASREWTVDTVAPAAPVLTAPAANATTSATPVFSGTAEPGSTVTVTVDGTTACTATADAQGAFSCAAPAAFPAGSHTVTATAKDPVGNTSTPSAGVPFTVDGAALDTAIIAGPSGTVRSTSAGFAFAATVLGATFECSLDGAAFTACATPVTFTGLGEGSHTLQVRAVSGATTDSTPASRTWAIDSVAPAAPVVLTPANNSTVYTRTPRYSGTAEPGATVRVSVDDRRVCTAVADAFGAWSCSSSTELASGPHRVAAVALDAAGNVSASSAVSVFTVDIPTVPVAITAPADGTLTNDATPSISGTTYPGATVTVFVDGVNVGTTTADASGNWSFTPATALADGARVVTAQADFMGHQSPTSNARTVRVDTTPPTVTLDIAQAEPARMPAVGFTTDETPVTWECSVDGAAFTACESPLDVATHGDGAHTVVARATDAAGNTGSATGSWTVVAPLNPPGDLPGELAIRGGGCGCGATDGLSAVLGLAAMLLLAARRQRRTLRRVTAGPAVLGVVLAAGLAQAQAQTQAVAGFDLERLDLNPGASASLITHTGDLLKKGAYRVSLTGHYQHDSLVLYRTQTNERLGAIVGSRLTAHLAGAWAPLEWLELGLQVPVVLAQGGDDLTGYGIARPVPTAFGTPWLTGRVGLLREATGSPLDLSLQLGLGLPFGTAGAYTNTVPVAFAPRVGLGKTVLPWLRVGGELGVVARGTPAVPGNATVLQPDVGPNFLYGLSATTLGEGVRGELTLRGGVGFDQGSGAAELLIGARYPFAKQFEVYALGGPGFGTLPGNPAFRLLAGVAWQPPLVEAPKKPVCDDSTPAERLATDCPELDRDGDGVKNSVDACVLVVGVEGRRGCPVPDTDQDGLTDDVDVCPKEAGLQERRGCPVRDLDTDGVEDDQDECPAEAGLTERKGCPVRDQDQDGVEDEHDECPAEAGTAERKGCPLRDQDEDTVEDKLDNCPTEKGDPENAGCPKKQKQLVIITADKLVIKEKVFFATGKSSVLAKSFPLLDNVARVLLAHPEVKLVRIEGHTDGTGSRETNLKLSQERADAVKVYLVKQKVEAERLKAVGFGPDQPTAPNDTAAGREQNRRVEFNFETPAKSTVQEVPPTP